MTLFKRIAGAGLVAGVLAVTAAPPVEAQNLTFTRGDLFSSTVHPSFLKFWETSQLNPGGLYFGFLTVGASGEWEPGTAYQLIWIQVDDMRQYLNQGAIAATTPTVSGPLPVLVSTPGPTSATAAPEPLSMLLLGTGLAGMGGFGAVRRRRRGAA